MLWSALLRFHFASFSESWDARFQEWVRKSHHPKVRFALGLEPTEPLRKAWQKEAFWNQLKANYGGCLKWWYPQNTPKWSFLVGKPMVVGYHHFRKHLYSCSFFSCYKNQVFVILWHIKTAFEWHQTPFLHRKMVGKPLGWGPVTINPTLKRVGIY